MADTKRKQIADLAIGILDEYPEGLRYSELWRQIKAADGSLKGNTITGNLFNLDQRHSDKVYKPTRGLFRLTKYRPSSISSCAMEQIAAHSEIDTPSEVGPAASTRRGPKESEFYEPFAKWIVGELGECTKAVPLGGCVFGQKWGTPDVIGVYAPRSRDLVKWDTEVVSVEIKTDMNQLVTAFGQACAYLEFSHKSYLVVPRDASKDDLDRLDSLCCALGIGLVVFNSNDPESSDFQIRVRASRHEPDMFAVNDKIDVVKNSLFD